MLCMKHVQRIQFEVSADDHWIDSEQCTDGVKLKYPIIYIIL